MGVFAMKASSLNIPLKGKPPSLYGAQPSEDSITSLQHQIGHQSSLTFGELVGINHDSGI